MPSPGDQTRPQDAAATDATVVAAPRADGLGPAAHPGEFGTLGPYRLVKLLGKGGMGAVYAAIDSRLGRHLAVKTLLPQTAADPDARERFLREARAAAVIDHDNVVTVYEADERDGVPYIAMQFLRGYSLDEYLAKKGELPVPQAVRVGAEAAAGLSAAHARGLIHRDIKPANLWLEAPNGRVKVLDFGLAKPADTDAGVTKDGVVVGTPAYMSPEQARGERVDARTDLFSLGAVLYRLLAGRRPFDGPNTMAVLTALAADDPTPLRALNPKVPEPLAGLVHQLLAKDPRKRPASAAEVFRRLKAISAAPAPAAPSAPAVAPAPTGSGFEVVEDHSDPFVGAEDTAVDAPPAERSRVGRSGARKAKRKAAREAERRAWKRLAAAVAAVALFVVVTVVVARPRKAADPKPDPEPTPRESARPAQPPAPRPPADDRQAAEWVLSAGGVVRVNGTGIDVAAAADLPKEPFKLTTVNLDGRPVAPDGLSALAGLPGLTELQLSKSGVTDAGLAPVKELPALKSLQLNGTKVTDAGLAHLADLKSLGVLNLNDTAVSDAGLARLKGLPALWQLYLSRTRVTDAGLAHLRDLKRLNLLELCDTAVTDAGLPHVGACRAMGHLNLSGTAVSDAGLVHLKELPLYALRLVNTKVDGSGLAHLAAVPELRHLVLTNTPLTDAGLTHLAEVPWLAYLDVLGTKVTRDAINAFHAAAPGCAVVADGGEVAAEDVQRRAAEWVLAAGGSVRANGAATDLNAALNLPKERFTVTAVDLSKRPVTDADLSNLRHLYDLTKLMLDDTKVTDAGLVAVGRLSGLTDLWLRGTRVTDAGLAHLRPLRRLTHLSLAFVAVTDAGLPHLAELKGLQVLGLDSTKVTGSGLAHLAKLPELHSLWLTGTPLADAGLAHLKGCPQLKLLVLLNAPLTDAGLAHLKECPRLEALDVCGTKVSADGLRDFRAAKPGCKVTSDPPK